MKFYIMWSLHNLQLINKKSQNFEKVTIDDRKILYSKKRSKKPSTSQSFILKLNTMFLTKRTPDQSISRYDCYRERVGENSHKQFFPVCNFIKLINAHYVTLQLDLTTLSSSNFPLLYD